MKGLWGAYNSSFMQWSFGGFVFGVVIAAVLWIMLVQLDTLMVYTSTPLAVQYQINSIGYSMVLVLGLRFYFRTAIQQFVTMGKIFILLVFCGVIASVCASYGLDIKTIYTQLTVVALLAYWIRSIGRFMLDTEGNLV